MCRPSRRKRNTSTTATIRRAAYKMRLAALKKLVGVPAVSSNLVNPAVVGIKGGLAQEDEDWAAVDKAL